MMDIDFPDRGYELGGRMGVRIILTPDRDARIRNARVDLVCNQTYTHHSAWKGSTIPRSLGRPMRPGGISVILTPHRDVRIRDARVDLVCDQTYTHHSAWEGGTVPRGGYSGRGVYVAGGMDVDQRTEPYVHSTVCALEDTSLKAGVTEVHRVDLKIDPMPPKRWN